MWDRLLAMLLLEENRGKVIGIGLGLIAAILFVTLGFWKTVFVIVCIAAGYFIGKKLDENDSFDNWMRKIFKSGD